MTKEALIEKAEPAFPREWLDEINADREALKQKHGLFPDSTPVIRELREHSEQPRSGDDL